MKKQDLFIISIALSATLHQIAQKGFMINIPFIDDYFDPFAGVILFLFAIQIDPFQVFKMRDTVFIIATVFFMLLSESLLPFFFPQRFFADAWDLLSIALGAGIFWIVFLDTNSKLIKT